MTFSSRIDRLMLGETGLAGVRFAPVLHARWTTQTTSDGSGLTPLAQDRASTPPSLSESGDGRFTIDDTALDPVGLRLALSVRDPASSDSEGSLFRSGLLISLPSLPANPAGFISLAFPDPSTITLAEANAGIAAGFAAGPMTTDEPGVTVTGAALAANPNRPSTWLMTAFGAYSGSSPVPGLATLFYRYSAEMSLAPVLDPFDTAHIVSVALSSPSVTFTDSPGGGGVVTVADSFAASFLNLVSPVIAVIKRSIVAEGVGEAIDAAVRGKVADAMGVPKNADGTPGALRPNVTVSVQTLAISGSIVSVNATVGAFGALSVTPVGSGGGCSMLIAGILVATAAGGMIWSLA